MWLYLRDLFCVEWFQGVLGGSNPCISLGPWMTILFGCIWSFVFQHDELAWGRHPFGHALCPLSGDREVHVCLLDGFAIPSSAG